MQPENLMIPVPHTHAYLYLREMSAARTRPGLFRCRTTNGREQDYVVKFHSRLGSCVVCEFMAALLGQQLELPIPPIAFVEVDPRISPQVRDLELRQLLAEDQGPHFGSQFQTGGYGSLPVDFSLPKTMTSQAADIFAFDMLIQNPDRTCEPGKGKPNLLFDGGRFLVFDHELAFSFVLTVGPVSPPWELRGLSFVRSHLFYKQLARHAENDGVSFEGFLSRLKAISDTFLGDMVSAMPENWRNPTMADRIVAHLTTVRENIPSFERGLLEALV